jgi:hypothetical protein
MNARSPRVRCRRSTGEAGRFGEREEGGAIVFEREAGLDRRVGVGLVTLQVRGA